MSQSSTLSREASESPTPTETTLVTKTYLAIALNPCDSGVLELQVHCNCQIFHQDVRHASSTEEDSHASQTVAW